MPICTSIQNKSIFIISRIFAVSIKYNNSYGHEPLKQKKIIKRETRDNAS